MRNQGSHVHSADIIVEMAEKRDKAIKAVDERNNTMSGEVFERFARTMKLKQKQLSQRLLKNWYRNRTNLCYFLLQKMKKAARYLLLRR